MACPSKCLHIDKSEESGMIESLPRSRRKLCSGSISLKNANTFEIKLYKLCDRTGYTFDNMNLNNYFSSPSLCDDL
jgi:hypothetical protein